MQSLGLSQQCGEDYSEVSLFLKKVLGLLLVPITVVSGASRLTLLLVFQVTGE